MIRALDLPDAVAEILIRFTALAGLAVPVKQWPSLLITLQLFR